MIDLSPIPYAPPAMRITLRPLPFNAARIVLNEATRRHYAQLGAWHIAVRVFPRKPPFRLLVLRPAEPQNGDPISPRGHVRVSRLGAFLPSGDTTLDLYRRGPDLVALWPRAAQKPAHYPTAIRTALHRAQEAAR